MYELSHPWAFLLLGLPFLIRAWLPAVRVNHQSALRLPFFQYYAQDASLHTSSAHDLWFRHWLGIWILLVLALTGPRWVGPLQDLPQASRNMILVLDISGSMGLRDMNNHGRYVTRWSVVQQTASDFVAKRPQDKIGLILFGERAYLFAPLTHDQKTLKQRIDDASVGLAGQATALGDAMGLAIKHLKTSPKKGRIMILLTDGVANAGIIAPLKAAEYAANEEIKIYAIGLGPDHQSQGFNQLFWQLQHTNDLDEKSLKQIADLTQGKYYRANDAKSLAAIYQDIEALEPVMQVREHIRPEHAYFYYPLALAFIWMMGLFCGQILGDWRRR